MTMSPSRRSRAWFGLVSLLPCTALAFVLVQTASGVVTAQTPSEEHRFEVASVKPQLSPGQLGAQAARAAGGNAAAVTIAPRMGIQTLPGGRFSASSVTLKQLVAHAFQVRDYQIEGGPNWLTSDYFEITALAGAEATPEDVQAMLRSLLAERFTLKTRIETRQAPVYALTMARSDGRLGPGLKRTTPECEQQIEARRKGAPMPAPPRPPSLNDFPTTPTCGSVMGMSRATGAQALLSGGFDLSSLLSRISNEFSAPVVDRTGLSGLFDITLEYTSERQSGVRPPGLDTNSTDVPPPLISAAVEQQLGLKLVKDTGPLDFVVIESAQPPTPD